MLRIGNGFDVHRFADGRKLLLGGHCVEGVRGLDGVSDADVVLHALADAFLGAVGIGDIGDLYPPEDPASKGLDSRKIMADVLVAVAQRGYRLVNADITIILEEVRLKRHKAAIWDSLAGLLACERDRVCFKIKSQEKLIPQENSCAMCFATVLLEKVTA
jgi:2-C-methyl-D-erythritol 2,4-cyclodiphosphate synthase